MANLDNVTQASIDAKITGEIYTLLSDGRTVVCELAMVNGWSVRGEFSCADAANFNIDLARLQSREEALHKIWSMEGYLVRDNIYNKSLVLTDSVFAPTSFWYSQIPADAPLHENSEGFLSDFLRQKKAFYGNVNINTVSFASPIYISEPNIQTVKVAYWNCQNKAYPELALESQWAAVPIPPYVLPASGSDSEMTIYQPSTDTLWEFWVTRKVDGQWQACWGGRMNNVSTSDGTWTKPYGTTATGLPFIGGQITAEELKRGEIRHAIGISLVEVESHSVVSWPAKRSDGWNPKYALNRIPEGLRFRLDPTVNVDALAMSNVCRIVAKAAQKYGFVVWDKAGAISIRAQNPKSYTALGFADPYPALFGNTPSYSLLNGFPWDKLQFMPMNYGKP